MENSHNRDTATMVTCKGDARFNAYPAEHTFFRNLTVTFVLLALLMICTTKPLWGQSDGDIYKTEIFRSIEAPRMDISTQGGFIEVIGTNEDDVVVEMFVRKGSRYLSPGEEDLSDYTIEIARTGNNIVVSAEQEGSVLRRGRYGCVACRSSFRSSSEVARRH